MVCRSNAVRTMRPWSLLPQFLGVVLSQGWCGGFGGFGGPAVLGIRVAAWCSRAPGAGSSGDCVAPPHLCCLHVVRNHVVERTRLAGLGNGQRAGMSGQEGRGNAGEHQAGQHGDGQNVLLDLVAALGLGGAKDDALDLVVDAAARLEGVRRGGGGEVVEVRLEEPEGLRALAGGRVDGDWRRTSRAPLTDSSHRSTMNSSRAIDSLSTLMSR